MILQCIKQSFRIR